MFCVSFVKIIELYACDLRTFLYICYVCSIKSLLIEKKENQIISCSRETLSKAIDVDERFKLYNKLLLLSFAEYELK